MATKVQTDFWPDGIFDNVDTGRREFWRDGRLCRFARKNAVGHPNPCFGELKHDWGHYPNLPANAAKEAA